MALFGLIKDKKSNLKDYSSLQVDMHSHFIPGIDDGAKTIEDSLALLSAMQELGYRKVITTPHIMADGYKNTPEIIKAGLEKVRQAVKQVNLQIEIEAGAEYYFDFDFEKKIKERSLLTFGSKNYVLWEVPFINPPDNMNQLIFDMTTMGYTPVLAHVERYGFWQHNFEKYEELINRGVLLQMNINSITGHYSIPTRKAAQWLIDKDMISFVGSDCHHSGHIELMRKALADKYLEKLLASNKLLNRTL